MPELLNDKIRSIAPSATLAVKAKAVALKAAGRNIIDLSAGEPDIDTPEHIKEATREALKRGETKYVAAPGLPALRDCIAKKFQEEGVFPAKRENVIVTNGGKQALHEIFEVCLNPGDEVIILAPYWVSYPPMVTLAGGVPKILELSAASGYKVTPDQLKGALTQKTRVVIFNSPSNPTGAAYSKDELQALGEVLQKSDCLVVSDEVYEKITFGDFEFCSFSKACPQLQDRTITVSAFSKTYSMTGWRLGYAVGPSEIITAMGKFQSQTTSNVCSFVQFGGIAALDGDHDFLVDLVKSFHKRMLQAVEMFNQVPGFAVSKIPEGAFYLFVRCDELVKSHPDRFKGSLDVAEYLIEEAGVAVVPGVAFGDDGAFRVSVAVEESTISQGIEQIGVSLKKLV